MWTATVCWAVCERNSGFTPVCLHFAFMWGATHADGENTLKWKHWTTIFFISIWSRSASCMSHSLSYWKEVTDAGISQQEAGVQKQLSKMNVAPCVSCLLLQSMLLVSTSITCYLFYLEIVCKSTQRRASNIKTVLHIYSQLRGNNITSTLIRAGIPVSPVLSH